jgi:hypothetical protein
MKTVYIPEHKTCDFEHNGTPGYAKYDAPTLGRGWANMCQMHFDHYASPFAHEAGYVLVVGEAPVVSDKDKRRALMDAIESGDFDAAEDIIGDGDIAEWL